MRAAIVIGACVVLLLAALASAEAAKPKKGGAYSGTVPDQGGTRGITDGGITFVVSKNGKKLTASLPALCGRNPHGVIKNIPISKKGKFSGKRSYKDTHASGEIFDWDLKISGRFTSRTKAKGVLTVHLETSNYNRGEPVPLPGVEAVCDSPKNVPYTVKALDTSVR